MMRLIPSATLIFLTIIVLATYVCCEERKYGKIAFLFLSRGPMPMEDIWYEFFNWRADPEDYSIYVHTAPGYKYSNDSVFYEKNKNLNAAVGWGKMSQVLAIKKLVREALKDPLNERFCLMSETCIPLISFPRWQSVMFNHSKSVVNACPMEGMEGDTRWHKDLDATGITLKDWRKSATWFALNRKHASVFVEETATEKAWDNVPCVDEHYLPTILAWKGLENETTCTDGFAYVHWPSASASHPLVYSGSDINLSLLKAFERPIEFHHTTSSFSQLCSGYEELCHFTARKFASGARLPLMMHLKYLFSEPDHPYEHSPWIHYVKRFRKDVAADGSEKLYLIEDNQIRMFPDDATVHAFFHMVHFHDSGLKVIPSLSETDRAENGVGNPLPTRRDGTIYKIGRNNELWYLKGGHRRSMPDFETFLAMNCTVEMIRQIAQHEIDAIPVGPPMPHIAG